MTPRNVDVCLANLDEMDSRVEQLLSMATAASQLHMEKLGDELSKIAWNLRDISRDIRSNLRD